MKIIPLALTILTILFMLGATVWMFTMLGPLRKKQKLRKQQKAQTREHDDGA